MRVAKSATVLFISMGMLGYAGCSILSPQDDPNIEQVARQGQYSFAYNVVINNKPAQDQLVFDDGKKTYFKITSGDNISQAYLIDHTGYNQVKVQGGTSYWSSNSVGKKWVIFLSSGSQIVSSKVQLPDQLPNVAPKEIKLNTEDSAKQLTVKERIAQLEQKLSGMIGLLTEYSTKNKKAKDILVQLDHKSVAAEKYVENSVIKKSNNNHTISSTKEVSSTKDSLLVTSASNRVKPQANTNKDSFKVIEPVAVAHIDSRKKSVKLENISVEKKTVDEPAPRKNIADVVINAKKSIVAIRESISKTLKEKIAISAKYNKSVNGNRYETNVPFAHGYRKLGPKGSDTLTGVVQTINNSISAKTVEVVGLATEDGVPDRNEWLASERASAVKKALIENGVNPEIIQTRRREQDQYGLAVKVSVTYNAELLSQN